MSFAFNLGFEAVLGRHVLTIKHDAQTLSDRDTWIQGLSHTLSSPDVACAIGSTTRAVLIATPPTGVPRQKIVPNQIYQSGANSTYFTRPSRETPRIRPAYAPLTLDVRS